MTKSKTFKVIGGDWAGHEFFFVAFTGKMVKGVTSQGFRAAFDKTDIVWM